MRRSCLILILLLLTSKAYPQQIEWADKVLKCTSAKGDKQHGCQQLLGSPNAMPQGGSNPAAWGPETRNDLAVLKLGFDKPLKAKQVLIAENHYPGCLYRVFVHTADGQKQKIYHNQQDTVTADKRLFHIPVSLSTLKPIRKVEIHVSGSYRKGWPQIDAVGLTTSSKRYQVPINTKSLSKQFGKAKPLSEEVNSRYDEVHPIINPSANRLYFVRTNHPDNKGGKDAGDAIWYLKRQPDGTWSAPKQLNNPLNTERSNAINAVLPGNNRVLVRDNYSKKPPKQRSIAISEKRALGWGKPEPQTIQNFQNSNAESSFFLANDGKTLIMAVERFQGEGGLDLFVSFKEGEKQWSDPQHLGPDINTPADEITPFLASDHRTLYFSTKGLPGYGNNDIFMAKRKGEGWTNWSEPVNLGKPINSSEWDAYLTLPASAAYAYFVSYRNQPNMADIYRIRMPVNLKPQPVKMAEGQVINDKTGQPMEAKVINENLIDQEQFAQTATAPQKGAYKSIIPEGQKSGIFAKSDDYMAKAETVDASSLDSFETVERNIRMIPLEVGQTIRLDNIFFEFNKSTLKPSSYPELNRVADIMNENPQMTIKVAGHTDSLGSKDYNKKLSKDRAKAVKNYLVSEKDISADRIEAKGFGESKPVATNETEKGRQKNRRVNFTILTK